MQLYGVFTELGEERLPHLLRSISIGKLRTFQLYERFKIRTHLAKVNTENLRKAAPRFWQRLKEGDNEFATDLSQAILVSQLEMITAVLDYLGIPNEQGFFAREIQASEFLTEGWQTRVWDEFHTKFDPVVLLFYINHLSVELGVDQPLFLAAA